MRAMRTAASARRAKADSRFELRNKSCTPFTLVPGPHTKHAITRRAAFLLCAVGCAACDGPQSALNPAGVEAERLADLFFRAGIELLETGTIQGAESDPSPEDWETEWTVIEADLAGLIPTDEVQKMKRLDEEARARGERELHVPTYFAWGRVRN